jgi:hypothetical protein
MYVPAYPLPIMEVASFVKQNRPETEIKIISLPVDFGIPLTREGKDRIYRKFLGDLAKLKPTGIGISCTAISQAEEVIHLCGLIKALNADIFIFLGGYFPTVYYEEIFARTQTVDLIVIGEGEEPALKIIECLEKGKDPRNTAIPNLAWLENGKIKLSSKNFRFDLHKKAPINLELLRHPKAYDILPYAFSRGCPYRCSFCMEEFIRPHRKIVPVDIVRKDLTNLVRQSQTHRLLISDALFKSFDFFPFLRSLGLKISFETRCDALDPSIIGGMADVCEIMAIGFESASYDSLRRMNKVRDRDHYHTYLSNMTAIFKAAVKHKIPMMVFMIAGYPGDTKTDLEESLAFVKKLSRHRGPGGYVFKIGECRVYPKTRIFDVARTSSDIQFDNVGVFEPNIVRQPSKNLGFDTVLSYMRKIFELSHHTHTLNTAFRRIMPFFRLPTDALMDEMVPEICYRGNDREIINAHGESLSVFRSRVPELIKKYQPLMSGQRSTRTLSL